MFNASGEVFQSLKTDLADSLAALQRANCRISLWAGGLILLLQVLSLLLPWYSESVLADSDYNYVFLFGVCRQNWSHYCRWYQTLIEECEGDCEEFEDNWRAGKGTIACLVGSGILTGIAEVNGIIAYHRTACCSLRLPLCLFSLLLASAGCAVWLQFSRYERASQTEAQTGMTLALASLILSASALLHAVEMKTEKKEFERQHENRN